MFRKFIYATFCILLICSCSKTYEDDGDLKIYRSMSEQQLYDNALEAVKTVDYSSAIKRLEAVDALYPFSPHAKQTQLYLIYSYFKTSDYAQSAAASTRFIHLYPRDKNVDYAYYMKGVANFEQQRGTFARIFNLDNAWRDPGTQLSSYHDFLSVINRFPDSRYYSDSLKRMIYLRNQFAQRELHIANFYMERKRYVAALERAKYVIKHYSQAAQSKKALVLSKRINTILHLTNAAQDDSKVLSDTFNKKV